MDRLEWIFERTITIGRGDGPLSQGTLRFGPIERLGPERWACYFCVSLISDPGYRIYGQDPMQALTNCVRFLSGLITGHEEDGWTIYWQYPGDHAGIGGMRFDREERDENT